ncbi:MAG: alpha-galactosidase [bacterium]|nr:alpha-galactosidase [bacterium]
MAVYYSAEDKTFTLQTEKSSYQMKVDEYGALLHTYFGTKMDGSDLSYLLARTDQGFSGNPADAKNIRKYSFDALPLEYPVFGNGDYRVNALRVQAEDGSCSCDLRYESFQIYQGKYRLAGLPALFAKEEDDSVTTLDIRMKDRYSDLYVHLLYGVFEKTGAITRAAIVENKTRKPLKLLRALSSCVDFADGDMEMVHFHGKHALERMYESQPLFHGITQIRSTRGTSSHQQNPFVIFKKRNTTEESGECYGFSFLYSGGFEVLAEVDQTNAARVLMGIEEENFCFLLEDGESFTTPEVCMIYSGNGMAELSHRYHTTFLEHLIRSEWKDKKRPVLVNNWEATYFDFNAEKLLKIASQAAELGLDMMVLDDGWFGKRDNDKSGLGDWFVNEEKLGCSLRELVEKINGMGLKFGIWFEPEMISEDSELYRSHPDWALQVPGREPIRGRSQLVLDFSRKDVREYVEEKIYAVMDSANIEYIKWDMNRSIADVYSATLPPEHQGEVLHRYVLGLYEMSEHLLQRYPHLLLEGCSGGGGRFDAGMLYYAPQIWCSDNTDAIERIRIQYGTSFGYPMSTVSAHVSVCPNHQNGRITPLKTRGICAMQGTFGYELDISKMSDEEKEEVRQQVKSYNRLYKLFQFGEYYRLTNPFEQREFAAWEYADKEQNGAILSVVFTDVHANARPAVVKWKGLCESAQYEIEGKCYSGSALMHGGYLLPVPKGDFDSLMLHAKRV